MKTFKCFIIVCLSLLCFDLAAQTPFYIYQKDGKINAFYTNEVDSIVLSKIDASGIAQADFIVQEYHAVDSIYRIPIASIDSVSFITPATVYQDNVIVLEGDVRRYIKKTEELNLYFSGDIPAALLPKIGQKVVSTIGDEYLASAFMGQVSAISNDEDEICVECEPVSATDVFEVYYGATQQTDEVESRGILDGVYSTSFELHPGPFRIDFIRDLPGEIEYEPKNLAYSVEDAHMNVEFAPHFKISAFTIINPRFDFYQTISIIGDYNFNEDMKFSGGISGTGELEFFKFIRPIPQALIDIYIRGGISLDFGVDASMSFNSEQKFRSVFHWEKSAKRLESVKNQNKFFPVSSTYNGEFALNGEVGLNLFVEPGVEFIFDANLDIAQINLKAKGGIKFGGQYLAAKADVETSKNTTFLYNKLVDKKIYAKWVYGVDVEAHFFKWAWKHEINLPRVPLNGDVEIFSYNAVPRFRNMRMLTGEYPFDCSSEVYGRSPKTSVGFALLSRDKSQRFDNYCGEYDGLQDGPEFIISNFQEADAESDYDLYATVNYMGNTLLAENYDGRFVDLGLSVLWAKYNVGATKPEECGDYYAWGETEIKSDYDIENWACDDETFTSLRSKGYINQSGNLTSEYDAAATNWEDCRMATKQEFEELVKECDWVYAARNGVDGYNVTGPNGNSIFIPFAGQMVGDSESGIGYEGGYLTSTKENSDTDEYYYLYTCYDDYFTETDGSPIVKSVGATNLYYGQSVRAVKEK